MISKIVVKYNHLEPSVVSLLLSVALVVLAAPSVASSTAPDAGMAEVHAVPAPPAFQPEVNDPLLEPAPRAGREVATWEEAFTRALEASTDERIAMAAVERAEGRWRQSLGVLLPNIRLTGSVIFDALNPTVPPIGIGAAAAGAPLTAGGTGASGKVPTVPLGTSAFNITQSVIDVGGWQGVGSAQAAADSARANQREVRRRITLGLARALVAVVAAERVAELNRLGLRQALERASLTERTQQLGAATQLDVVRVRQDVEVARSTLLSGDEQLIRTREALGLALGFGGEVGVPPAFALDSLVEETRRRCGGVDWKSRPDVEAAKTNVTSARRSRQQASSGYIPSVGVTSNLFGFTTQPGFGRLAAWSLSAVLTIPIWEGGSREGLVKERAGIEKQADQALVATERQVSIEVAQARRGVQVAESLLRTAAQSRELAAQLDTLTRRSFEVGRGTSVELVQSAGVLRQADVFLATREFELVQAQLNAFLTEARCDG